MTSLPYDDADLNPHGLPPTDFGPTGAGLEAGHGLTADRVAWLTRLADGLHIDPPADPETGPTAAPGPVPAPPARPTMVDQLIGGPATPAAPATAPMIDQLVSGPAPAPVPAPAPAAPAPAAAAPHDTAAAASEARAFAWAVADPDGPPPAELPFAGPAAAAVLEADFGTPAPDELATLAAIATRLTGSSARRQAEGNSPGLFGVGADSSIIGLLAQSVATSARQLQLAADTAQRAEEDHFKAAMIAARRADEVAALGRMADALDRFELLHGLGVVAAELAGLRGIELSRISVATPDGQLVEVASGASYCSHFGPGSEPDQPGSPERLAVAGGELVVWRRPPADDRAVVSGLVLLGLTSAFVIPLWWGDEVVGTILAGSTGGHRLVTDEHMMVAAVAADLIMEAAGHPDALYRVVARRSVGV